MPPIVFDEDLDDEQDGPGVSYPGDDGTVAPGDDYEWKGKLPIGGDKGAWVNGQTGEQYHPDLNHKPPKKPHWDYKDILGRWWRIFADNTYEPR